MRLSFRLLIRWEDWEGEAPAEPKTSFSSEAAGGWIEASGGRRPLVVLGSAGASPSQPASHNSRLTEPADFGFPTKSEKTKAFDLTAKCGCANIANCQMNDLASPFSGEFFRFLTDIY